MYYSTQKHLPGTEERAISCSVQWNCILTGRGLEGGVEPDEVPGDRDPVAPLKENAGFSFHCLNMLPSISFSMQQSLDHPSLTKCCLNLKCDSKVIQKWQMTRLFWSVAIYMLGRFWCCLFVICESCWLGWSACWPQPWAWPWHFLHLLAPWLWWS